MAKLSFAREISDFAGFCTGFTIQSIVGALGRRLIAQLGDSHLIAGCKRIKCKTKKVDANYTITQKYNDWRDERNTKSILEFSSPSERVRNSTHSPKFPLFFVIGELI